MKGLFARLNNNYISIRESIRLLSIMSAFILCLAINNYYFLFTWIIHLLIILNIRRINGKNMVTYALRISGYFAHLGIFSLFYVKDFSTRNHVVVSVIIMIFAIAVYFYRHLNEFRVKLSIPSISRATYKYSKSKYITLMYNQIGAAVCEELYFRLLLMKIFNGFQLYSILISAIFFVLFHYTLCWGNRFKTSAYIEQFIFGIVLATIFYLSHNIILSIIVHCIINFPILYLMMRLYHRDYVNPDFYADSSGDEFDDLKI